MKFGAGTLIGGIGNMVGDGAQNYFYKVVSKTGLQGSPLLIKSQLLYMQHFGNQAGDLPSQAIGNMVNDTWFPDEE